MGLIPMNAHHEGKYSRSNLLTRVPVQDRERVLDSYQALHQALCRGLQAHLLDEVRVRLRRW